MADDETTQPDAEESTEVTDAVEATAAEPSAPASLAAEAEGAEAGQVPVEDAEPAPDVEAEAAAAAAPVASEAAAGGGPVGEPPVEDAAAETPQPETSAGQPPGAGARAKRARKRLPRALRRRRPKTPREQPAERRAIVRLPKPEHERGRRQERRGVVVSASMDKTIVVLVETIKAHRRYKKVVRRSTKFHAHDEQNAAGVGDVVRIVETRPLSKTKNWRLAEVVEKAK
ncbi:MAG: 30S ribosomal protein S17 [Thermoleophilia bacterium]|nr:30S ribosomal protein S17 [Thermoleophilia bacterium]